MFPEEKQVLEGEEVVFRVKVTGTPSPNVIWYHNEEELVVDYSHELAEDGSLIIPSTELKHSGVYQLKQENPKCNNVAKKQTSFSPIPVEEFSDYVCKCHANDNEIFRDQYTV